MGKHITIFLVVAFACAMIGCAGGQSSVSQISADSQLTGNAAGTGDSDSLINIGEQITLPPPSQLRKPSYIESSLYIDGSAFVTELPNQGVTANATYGDFVPSWNGASPANADLAYAMYEYSLPDYDREESLYLFWEQTNDFTNGWIGVANWYHDNWEWYDLPENNPVPLDFSNQQYFPGGRILIVVLFTGDQPWTLDYMRMGELMDTLLPPGDVQATDGTDSRYIHVTWERSVGATGYQIFRDTQDMPVGQVGDEIFYNDTETEWNDEHTYWVKAFNAIAESEFSASDTGWRKPGPPDPPTNVQASDGLSFAYIEVTWTKAEGATGYAVYYDKEYSKKVELGDVDYWRDSLVLNTNPHTYWVASINEYGIGELSDSDTGYLADPSDPPGLPTNLQASDDEYNDRIVLTWTKANAATGYDIYRDVQDTKYDTVFDTDTWTDHIVPDTNQHEYWLKAYNPNGESEFSESDLGSRTAPIVPEAPTDLQATDGDYDDKIVLTWTKATDAISYNVYRDFQTVLVAEDIGDVDTWDDLNVGNSGEENTHTYWVSGISTDDAEGPKCDPDTGWRAPVIPLAPTNVQASDGTYDDKIAVTWTKAEDATGYKIYKDFTGSPVDEVGDVDTWDDMFVSDSGSENTHEYWVRAFTTDGDSPLSTSDTGWRAPNLPDAPTGLDASDGLFTDRVRLSWVKSDGATGYEIYRDDNSGDPYETVGDISSWDDLFLVPDYDVHTYWLKAVNDDGESGFSESDTGYADEP